MAKVAELMEKIKTYQRAKNLSSADDVQASLVGLNNKTAELITAYYKNGGNKKIEELLLDILVWGLGALATNGSEDVWTKLESLVERNATREFSNPL